MQFAFPCLHNQYKQISQTPSRAVTTIAAKRETAEPTPAPHNREATGWGKKKEKTKQARKYIFRSVYRRMSAEGEKMAVPT
jgi:hypothetical protein